MTLKRNRIINIRDEDKKIYKFIHAIFKSLYTTNKLLYTINQIIIISEDKYIELENINENK